MHFAFLVRLKRQCSLMCAWKEKAVWKRESRVGKAEPHMRLHEVPKLEVYDQVCPPLQCLPLAGLLLFLLLQPLHRPLPPPLVLRISLL